MKGKRYKSRVACPYCDKEVLVTPTISYWYHRAEDVSLNAKGHSKNFCIGSGEALTPEHKAIIDAEDV